MAPWPFQLDSLVKGWVWWPALGNAFLELGEQRWPSSSPLCSQWQQL